jgi:hypothetical protein
MKKIALCLGFVAATAWMVSTVGCGDSNNNTGGGGADMAMGGGSDLAGGGGADMSFVCIQNPMMGDDFFNSCAPASVQFVDITPFYPSLAPNGQLPPLN